MEGGREGGRDGGREGGREGGKLVVARLPGIFQGQSGWSSFLCGSCIFWCLEPTEVLACILVTEEWEGGREGKREGKRKATGRKEEEERREGRRQAEEKRRSGE